MVEERDHSQRRRLSAAKRALLDKRLRGEFKNTATQRGVQRRSPQAAVVPSFGQERLWYLHQLYSKSPAYNMHVSYRLEGPLNIELLAASVNEIVRLHEVLRTTFDVVDGRIVPIVAPDLSLSVPVEDLSSLPPNEQDGIAQKLAEKEARRPFNLAEGPLIRALVLRLADADHRLSLTMHHIVADEWSLDVFWREMALTFDALSTDRPCPLTKSPLGYADFAVWQRERVSSGDLDEQLSYWKTHLDGVPPTLSLPTDHPRPARQSLRGALQSALLPPELSTALRRLAQKEKVSLFALLLTAFKTLLHRYTGQTDVFVGTPFSNRNHLEIEPLIGFFVNTLVLRSVLSGDSPFLDVLERVRTTTLEAFAHQDVPFEELVRQLRPERKLAYNPLFQVMFVLQQEAKDIRLGPNLSVQPVPVDYGASKFDLTMFVAESRSQQLKTMLEYSTDLFDADTIKRMLGHWHVLLEAIVADPSRRVSELRLLTQAERNQLLVEWNDTAAAYPKEVCVHELVEAQAEHNAKAIAVLYEREQLTYAELNHRSNLLAHRLRCLGIGPDVRVGLNVTRSIDMVVGVLAILKAGGAYVPLDPEYPVDRLRFMMEDAKAAVLLVQKQFVGQLPDVQVPVVCLDDIQLPTAASTGVDANARPKSDHLAYVIYTSGSTGEPKGVLVSHRNLIHSTSARDLYYPEAPGRFLLLSSFAFDSSIAGIFWTLCHGGTLVLPAQGLEQDIGQIANLIDRHSVTHVLCLPSLYGIMLDYEAADLKSLRTVIVAGEACSTAVVRRHHELLSHIALYNEYGPTEATVWSTVYRTLSSDRQGPVPIGRPIPNAQVFLLDDNLEPVPIGVCGEIFVGGEGVATGYLNRPELTTERFIQNPFTDACEARLYRTGDIARMRPDGNLVFVGRADRQVKIRGYRIELGEVEDVLKEHSGIANAAVIARGIQSESRDSDYEHVQDADSATLCRRLLLLGVSAANELLDRVENMPDNELGKPLAERSP